MIVIGFVVIINEKKGECWKLRRWSFASNYASFPYRPILFYFEFTHSSLILFIFFFFLYRFVHPFVTAMLTLGQASCLVLGYKLNDKNRQRVASKMRACCDSYSWPRSYEAHSNWSGRLWTRPVHIYYICINTNSYANWFFLLRR